MASTASLMGKAVRGAAWTILTGIGSRGLGLVGTLALTWYLSTEVQGEVSNAFIIVLTAHQLSAFGLAQYLIANPKSGREETWNILVFQVLTGVLFLGAAVIFRDHFGTILKSPALGRYVPGLAVAMMLERIGIIPERILARELRFRAIGIARTSGEILYTIVSVVLAMLGAGGMAVVYGNIARNIAYLGIIGAAADRREWLVPSRLSRDVLRPAFKYGLPLSVSTFATFAARRWDNLIISSLFGASVVGEYNLAYNLADIPAIQVGEQIGDVLFPSFAKMDPESRKDALVRATGLLAIVVFPLAVGLGAIAPSIVHTLLRDEWAGVAPMLVILSVLSVVRPIGWTIQAYLQASNQPRAAMWLGLSKIAFLMTALVTVGRLGPLWACTAVGIAFAGHSLASIAVAQKLDRISMSALLGRCATPLLACAPMVLAILAVRHGLAHVAVPKGIELALEILVGGIAYLAGAFTIARSVARELIALVKDAIARRRGGASDD